MGEVVKGTELVRRAAARGLEASAFFIEGTANIGGYTIAGPRGSKTVMAPDDDGLYSIDRLTLFADGCDYATNKIAERKAR